MMPKHYREACYDPDCGICYPPLKSVSKPVLREPRGAKRIKELEARVAEMENENRILKNEVDDLRSFAKLNTDHAKKILGIPLK
jgi:hypothetical protein